MNIDVRFRGMAPSEDLRAHATRKVLWHFGRLAGAIDSVVVRIEDVNGPKGGLDTRCQVSVRGPLLGWLTVESVDTAPSSGIDGAVDRMARTIVRELERARAPRRHERFFWKAS